MNFPELPRRSRGDKLVSAPSNSGQFLCVNQFMRIGSGAQNGS